MQDFDPEPISNRIVIELANTSRKVFLPSDLLCRNLRLLKIYVWGGDVVVSWNIAGVGILVTADRFRR
jgi:hypothetical protein